MRTRLLLAAACLAGAPTLPVAAWHAGRQQWIVAGDDGALYRGDADARLWQVDRDPQAEHLGAIAPGARPGTLVAAGPTGTVMRRRDDGRSWQVA